MRCFPCYIPGALVYKFFPCGSSVAGNNIYRQDYRKKSAIEMVLLWFPASRCEVADAEMEHNNFKPAWCKDPWTSKILYYYTTCIGLAFIQPSFKLQASQSYNYVEMSIKIASLINSLAFLKQGLYPTLLHRTLNLRTQLVDPNQPRSVDLTTLTRELLWHSFAVSFFPNHSSIQLNCARNN